MKIVILPGVGFHIHTNPNKIQLIKHLKKAFPQCSIDYFNWDNQHVPTPPLKDNWLIKKARAFIIEVIKDFDAVCTKPLDIFVPEADIYIGHSAGSILAIIRNKPAIVFGSPYSLIRDLYLRTENSFDTIKMLVEHRNYPVLNIINKKDLLAYHIDSAENYYFKGGFGPISAHLTYWSNKTVIEKITEKIKHYLN